MRGTTAFTIALLAAACGTAEAPGHRGLEVVVSLQEPADASRVEAVVEGADLGGPAESPLAAEGGAWRGAAPALHGHAGITVVARARSASGALVAEARAADLPLLPGDDGLLLLSLAPAAPAAARGESLAIAPAAPPANRPPVILWLLASSTLVETGKSIQLSTSATDPDPGDSPRLTYRWTAPAGTFSKPTSPSTSWTAPTTEMDVALTLTVRDPKGASATASVVVQVRRPPGRASVRAVVNNGPRVTAMTVADGQLALGQPTALTAAGFDPEGDAFSWSWSASCAGSFSAPSAAATTFTPAAPYPPGGACTLVATLRDARGGVGEGRVGIAVTAGPAPGYAPVFGLTWQDAEVAFPGDVLAFEVAASSPSGLPLAFSWTASAGALAGASPSAGFDSAVRWTAACAPGGFATLVATAGDGTLSSSQGFVVAVPACP